MLLVIGLRSESITTNLTDEAQIRIFHEVTSKIRCICLPSLPIKSCSFNNCEVSALLKNFIENRVRAGEGAEMIVQKMLTGFGEEALKDPIIQRLERAGNYGIVQGVVYGFGEKILADPDSTGVNLTLLIIGVLGLGLIFFYWKKVKSSQGGEISAKNDKLNKYLGELD
jgi:cytochrome c-type biogenesis protein CcmH/NrfF